MYVSGLGDAVPQPPLLCVRRSGVSQGVGVHPSVSLQGLAKETLPVLSSR